MENILPRRRLARGARPDYGATGVSFRRWTALAGSVFRRMPARRARSIIPPAIIPPAIITGAVIPPAIPAAVISAPICAGSVVPIAVGNTVALPIGMEAPAAAACYLDDVRFWLTCRAPDGRSGVRRDGRGNQTDSANQ